MSKVSFFQMPDLDEHELKNLFNLIIPQYTDLCCIACGFNNGAPLAIVATGNDQLGSMMRSFSEGVTELDADDVPKIQYHLSGDQSLWTAIQA